MSIVPVGQVVGQVKSVRKKKDVATQLVEGYVEAIDRLNAINERARADIRTC